MASGGMCETQFSRLHGGVFFGQVLLDCKVARSRGDLSIGDIRSELHG